jgi:hypothetical protein
MDAKILWTNPSISCIHFLFHIPIDPSMREWFTREQRSPFHLNFSHSDTHARP